MSCGLHRLVVVVNLGGANLPGRDIAKIFKGLEISGNCSSVISQLLGNFFYGLAGYLIESSLNRVIGLAFTHVFILHLTITLTSIFKST